MLALPVPAAALEQKVTAADGAAFDRLGDSVAIDGDTAVVGAWGDDGNGGAVYVFTRTGDSLAQTAKLTASDGVAGDFLDDSVAIDGDTIVGGAPGDDEGRGAVYVFTRTGDSWAQTAKLTASDGVGGDFLGDSVAIDGDTIVAGAPFDNLAANGWQGSAYTFARTGAAARTETAKLTASDTRSSTPSAPRSRSTATRSWPARAGTTSAPTENRARPTRSPAPARRRAQRPPS